MNAVLAALYSIVITSGVGASHSVPTLLWNKLAYYAGQNAKDCGSIAKEDLDGADPAIACAKLALQHRENFRVAIEYPGIDSIAWTAIASNRDAQMWVLDYDSYGPVPFVWITRCLDIAFEPMPGKVLHQRDHIRCKVKAGETTLLAQ